ncbi:MAG: FHA domain-containing protein [Planctomycetaceae bacterium]
MSDVVTHPLRPLPSTSIAWQLHFAASRDAPVFSVSINTARFRVGRRDSAEFVLPSPQISGLHAEFAVVGLRLFVRDLASTNGTYVNGKRIGYRDVALRDGDHLRMANVEFVVRRARTEQAADDTAVLEDEGSVLVDHDGPPLHDPAWIFDADDA